MITNKQQLNHANELRKNGQFENALLVYRELSKDSSDSFAAAGVLYCLRKLGLFNEALRLCINPPDTHLRVDWYRNEVIWTLIQGKLNKFDDKTSLVEVISVAESILALQPKETQTS